MANPTSKKISLPRITAMGRQLDDTEPDYMAYYTSYEIARDEIERLQMRLKRHEPVSLYNGRDIDSWKSEAERLRAALAKIAAIQFETTHVAEAKGIAIRALQGSPVEMKAQPDTNKNRIVLELRDRAGQCYRHDDGLADLLLRAAEWINRLQLPQVETAALSEAETLLQAWADLLPPNGKLYWQHVEKAREYFRRRGLTQETKPECICPRRDTDDAIIYTHLACPTHGTLSQKASAGVIAASDVGRSLFEKEGSGWRKWDDLDERARDEWTKRALSQNG